MCDANTPVMPVSDIVQAISLPLSTNVVTPVPVVVFGVGSSFEGNMVATKVLFVGPVESDPQLVARAATATAATRPRANVLTVLRMKPPGGRKIEARPELQARKAGRANDCGGAASSTSGTAGAVRSSRPCSVGRFLRRCFPCG